MPHHVSRRSVVTTTAWSVPALTVVGASPAFAVSPPAASGADLTLELDYHAWVPVRADEPERLYSCTLLRNLGTTPTTGPYTVTLTVDSGVVGKAIIPHGMTETPSSWRVTGNGTSTVVIEIPDPLPPLNMLHTSYYWYPPAGVTSFGLEAAIVGGGEDASLNTDNRVAAIMTW